MVKRYEPTHFEYSGIGEKDDGDYVLFTDHAELERERDALREALEGLASAVENLGYGTIGECEDARQLLAKEST